MRKHKTLAALVLCLPLAACFKEQEAKTAECQFKVQSVSGDRTWSVPAKSLDEIELMTLCMKAAGFEFNTESKKCAWHGDGNAYIGPRCYVPRDALLYWGDRLERYSEFYLMATPKK